MLSCELQLQYQCNEFDSKNCENEPEFISDSFQKCPIEAPPEDPLKDIPQISEEYLIDDLMNNLSDVPLEYTQEDLPKMSLQDSDLEKETPEISQQAEYQVFHHIDPITTSTTSNPPEKQARQIKPIIQSDMPMKPLCPKQNANLEMNLNENEVSEETSNKFDDSLEKPLKGILIEYSIGGEEQKEAPEKTLAEKFKECGMARRLFKKPKLSRPPKPAPSKEELINIRKEMLKPKIQKKPMEEKCFSFEMKWNSKGNFKKAPSELMQRLATGQKARVSKREMKSITKRNYENLPEVRQKREEEIKRQENAVRLLRAKEYQSQIRYIHTPYKAQY